MNPIVRSRWQTLLAGIACILAAAFVFSKRPGVVTTAEAREEQPAVENTAADFTYDSTPLNRSIQGVRTSYADVLEGTSPSVVSVYTARIVKFVRGYTNPREELFRRFFGLPGPRVSPQAGEVEERLDPTGMGSGVIIATNGYILTNNHVITDQRGQEVDEVLVQLSDGTELEARIVGRDPKTDIALLKVESDSLPSIPIADSDQIRVGDIVFAIGNPMQIGQTVTQGIVSATGRSHLGILGENAYENFIQTDASINSGNSGGALIDAHGRLIGINSAIVSPTGGNIGIGFAVPSNIARGVMENLIEDGRVQRGLLGVTLRDLNADMAEAFGLDSPEGALVETVQDGLPAAESGIQRGDVIVSLDGEPVTNVAQLRLAIAQQKPDTSVTVTIIRENKTKEFEVVLGDLDNPYGKDQSESTSILEGVIVGPLDRDLRQKYRIDQRVTGVIILQVARNSPYADGFRPGMVIVEINDRAVDSNEAVREALIRGLNKLWIFDNGSFRYLALRLS